MSSHFSHHYMGWFKIVPSWNFDVILSYELTIGVEITNQYLHTEPTSGVQALVEKNFWLHILYFSLWFKRCQHSCFRYKLTVRLYRKLQWCLIFVMVILFTFGCVHLMLSHAILFLYIFYVLYLFSSLFAESLTLLSKTHQLSTSKIQIYSKRMHLQ